jgi:peptidyl-prolyl cis-trans isomerase C
MILHAERDLNLALTARRLEGTLSNVAVAPRDRSPLAIDPRFAPASDRVPRGRSGSGAVALGLVALVLALGVTSGDAATKKATKASVVAKDPVLARVGNATVTKSEYEARLAELPAQYKGQFSTPEQKRQFIDRLLEEKVWIETALRAKVDQRPEIKKQFENYRRDTLIRTYLGEAMQKAPPPADSLISNYYENHLPEFTTEEQVQVRQIQVADEKTAKKVKQELDKGGDFAALAKKYSTDAVTKEKGGDLGPVSKSGFFGSLGRQPALAESAFAAPLNTTRGPIKTGLGYHVIEVTAKIAPKAKPLEEVKPMIVRALTQQTNQDFYQQSLVQAKAALGVKMDDAAIDAAVNAKKSAVEMFRDAGEVPAVEERLKAYREVLASYPESEYAPQALFMVGFVESEEKKDYDQAELAFKELIAKYPNSELASSAQWMLANMRSDKTPDFDLPGDLGKASEHDSKPGDAVTKP